MAVNLSALAGAGQQFFDNTGVPLTGGKLYSYAAGTTTPQATYTTAAGTIAHANPIILDSAGRVSTGEIWLTAGSNYKFVLKTSTDTTLATWDNITGINGTGITSNASNVQYDPEGTGAVSTTIQAKLRQYVSVKDFGATGDGSTNDTAAIQAALDSGAKSIYIPSGTYKITTMLTMPVNTEFVGDGINATNIVISADVVGILVQYYCKVQGIKITKSGAHTKNGIDIGNVSLDAGRSVIQDVWVNGVGNDGIQVRQGNLGSIRDVVVTSCGRDGINFTLETNDNNAWTLDGFVDVRGNTRDGICIVQGSSASDSLASKSHSFNLVIAQQNGRYGVYSGTRSNAMVIYGEANGPDPLNPTDIYIDTYGRGNFVTLVEGYYTNNSTGTILTTHNTDADYIRSFRGKTRFQGGTGNGITIDNSDGVPGQLSIEKTGSSTYRFQGYNTSQTAFFNFTNEDYPTYQAYMNLKGDIDLRNIYVQDGADYGKLKFNNINQIGTLSLYKSADRTYYFQTSATAGTSEVNFDTNDGPTNWYFRGFTMPKVDNSFALGNSGNRWSEVFAANGTINTSDERSKQQILPIDATVLKAWAKVEYFQYKFNDAVEKKGSDNARIHIGLVAQRVKEAFESEGLDAFKYGLLCYDEFEDQYEDVFADVEVTYPMENGEVRTEIERRPSGEKKLIRAFGSLYGIRYEQALALECAYLRSKLS